MKLTDLLDQIQRLDREATKGPWRITETDDCEGLQIAHVKQLGKSLAIAEHRVVHIDEEDADATLITLSRTALPALAQAVRRLLEDHRMVTTSWGEEQCATCIIDAGATGADRMEWPCDIYTTITTALGEDE